MTHTMSGESCAACGSPLGCRLVLGLREERLTLDEFWFAHGHWSQAAFGADGLRGPRGPLKHLVKEIVREVLPLTASGEVFLTPDIALEEFCDLILLVFDATRRAGFTLRQISVACCQKLKKNMARKWPPIGNLHEPIEHFRERGEAAHDGVDALTELWAITDAECESEDTDGIVKAAIKMIDRLQDKLRKAPAPRPAVHLANYGVLQLAIDQLHAMRKIAGGYMTADDTRVLEATIANCERHLGELHSPKEVAAVRGRILSATHCADMLDRAWGIIANAGFGDWTRESADWQAAAARWREEYHAPLPDPAAVAVQPAPKPATGPDVHDLVCEDMQARKKFGIGKYGQALRVHDGRTTLIDYYQELLDAAAYCKKELLERGIDHAPEAK